VILLIPRIFTAPLMADLSEAEAIRELAQHTEAVKLKFQEFATYNINIITGNAFYRDEHVYNVGFLCKRDGTNEMYRKIHITPNEVFHWELQAETQSRPLIPTAEK
jgi:predicted amidohydrolase